MTKKKKTTPTKTSALDGTEWLGLIVLLIFLFFIPELLGALVVFGIFGAGAGRLTYWNSVDSLGTRGKDYDNPLNR